LKYISVLFSGTRMAQRTDEMGISPS